MEVHGRVPKIIEICVCCSYIFATLAGVQCQCIWRHGTVPNEAWLEPERQRQCVTTHVWMNSRHGKSAGQWRGGVQQGHGVCEYASGGGRYEGAWAAGARHGRGTLVTGHYKYGGEWADDQQEGQGQKAAELKGGRLQCTFCRIAGWKMTLYRHRCCRSQHMALSPFQSPEAARKKTGSCNRALKTACMAAVVECVQTLTAAFLHFTCAGSCLLECGDRYQGRWRGGRRHGTGSCLFVNGDK